MIGGFRIGGIKSDYPSGTIINDDVLISSTGIVSVDDSIKTKDDILLTSISEIIFQDRVKSLDILDINSKIITAISGNSLSPNLDGNSIIGDITNKSNIVERVDGYSLIGDIKYDSN